MMDIAYLVNNDLYHTYVRVNYVTLDRIVFNRHQLFCCRIPKSYTLHF